MKQVFNLFKKIPDPPRAVVTLLPWLGIALGLILTAFLWLGDSKQTYTSLRWISYAGMTCLGLYLLFRTRRRAFTLLVLFASVSILYLFPALLGPGCDGMPRAFGRTFVAAGGECENKWDCANGHCCGGECYDDACGGGDPPQILPPAISSTISCALGSNGWCVGNAQLILSASDPQGYGVTISGSMAGTPIYCPGSYCAWSLPPASGGAASYTVTASSGLTASGGTNWWYDPTPPISNVSVSGASGSNGWYVSPVTATAGGSDSISGLASATLSVDGIAAAGSAIIRDGVHSVTVSARDVAGNISSKTVTISVDTIAPVSNVNVSGTSGLNGWYVSQVNASAGGSDSISGLASATLSVNGGAATGSAILRDGVHSVVSTARDVAGNMASRTQTISVDSVAPTIFISAAGNQALDGWFTSEVDLSATASDTTSGVNGGVSMSLDNGTTWEVGSRILNSGLYDVLFRVPDRAGNIATSQMSLKIDTQPPTIILSEAGSLGRDGWYVSAATVSANVGDNLSGITSIQYRANNGVWQDGDSVIVEEGIHRIEFQAFDAAGNRTQSAPQEIRVDLTPPASTFDAALNGAVLADTVTLGGTVSDGTSGVQGVEFSADGTTWQAASFAETRWNFAWDSSVFDNGDHDLYLRVDDLAGNKGQPIRARVILDNDPPYVKLAETWNVWESGSLVVFNNVIPLKSVRIIVHDPILRYADQVIYADVSAPDAVTWDRVIGPASAPPGLYTVTVEVCDIYALCAKDTGTILIPVVPAPAPVPTQPAEPKRWWSLPVTIPRLPAVEPAVVIPAVVVPIQEEVQVVPSFPFWTMVVVSAFLLSFILLLLLDSRPKAWRSLTQQLADSMMSNE